MTDDRKDYILNLRVSRATYEKLKNRAKENRETMSNLARKMLDDGIEIIGDVSDELFGKSKKEPEIVYSYNADLAQTSTCDQCGCELQPGKKIKVAENKVGKKFCFCTKCYA